MASIQFQTPNGATVSIRIDRDGDAYDAVVMVNGRRHFSGFVDLMRADWGWFLRGVSASGDATREADVGVPELFAASVGALIAQPGASIEDRQQIALRRAEFFRAA